MSDMHSRSGRRLNVAVLCSRRAPGLVQLLNRDARRGIDYEIVCCITSSDTFSEEVRVERRGVPCLPHSIRTSAATEAPSCRTWRRVWCTTP